MPTGLHFGHKPLEVGCGATMNMGGIVEMENAHEGGREGESIGGNRGVSH